MQSLAIYVDRFSQRLVALHLLVNTGRHALTYDVFHGLQLQKCRKPTARRRKREVV